ncbi:MAG TPA: phosphodiester glycosidase family protein [Longimicrobium sp.]|nr:phosphodiester glycosidase family protein [Longimicrobium sp.]
MRRSLLSTRAARWLPAGLVLVSGGALALADARSSQTRSAQAPVACRQQTIAAARYRVCEIAPGAVPRLQLVARDGTGRAVQWISRVDELVRARGERLLFATNAGLYESVDSATGLLVADGGRTYSRLNRLPGPPNPCRVANFYCPPNGVFFVSGGRAAVLSTADFAARPASAAALRLATQSGPMLVRRGRLAPSFAPTATSRKVRNGVGVRADGTVVFVISDTRVTFYELATAFRDTLRCPDALFLDGEISQMYTGGTHLPPRGRGFAAVFAVTEAAGR